MMKRYPIGIQDFKDLIEGNYLYVDKTQNIFHLINSGKFFFYSRPRRFGKSLLLSTIKYIFQGKKHLFKGLWLENKHDWEVYPVIHLSFSSIGYRELGLEKAISLELNTLARQHEISLEEEGNSRRFRELLRKLHEGGKKVIILIDEYDKPIIDYLDDMPQAKANQLILRNFYGIIKDADPYIRFLLITGVSKFSKVSIFSELNNLQDLTLHPRFSTLVGYTQAELEHYFAAEIEDFATKNQLSREALLQKIKAQYNGYSWDGINFVYNPISVLSYFDTGQFRNFWFTTGTPTFLIKLLRGRNQIELEGNKVDFGLFESYDLEKLETLALLFQTGYLTIKEIDQRGFFLLEYPNKEVKESMLSHLIGSFRHDDSSITSAIVFDIQDAFRADDLDLVVKIINSLFKNIPSHIFIKEKEAYYHAIIYLVFNYLGQIMEAEVHTSYGRIDAVVETASHIYLLEFKLDKSAAEALSQIIQKKYADKYLPNEKKVNGIGINFSSETKSVSDWEVKELG